MCITEQIQQSNHLDWNSDPSHADIPWMVVLHRTHNIVDVEQHMQATSSPGLH